MFLYSTVQFQLCSSDLNPNVNEIQTQVRFVSTQLSKVIYSSLLEIALILITWFIFSFVSAGIYTSPSSPTLKFIMEQYPSVDETTRVLPSEDLN